MIQLIIPLAFIYVIYILFIVLTIIVALDIDGFRELAVCVF
jgi:hypothetical protein